LGVLLLFFDNRGALLIVDSAEKPPCFWFGSDLDISRSVSESGLGRVRPGFNCAGSNFFVRFSLV
jgi:hypothetical protein